MSDDRRTAAGTEPWTVRRTLDWTTGHLRQHGSDSPRLDAEILLAHARGCKRIELYTRYEEELSDEERSILRDLVKRRAKHEPVAYLVGRREFFSLDFRVTADVLIPRPDTETLVVETITAARLGDAPRVLDLGTGSGCVAIAAAVHVKTARVTAVDQSAAALAVAQENAAKHGVADRMEFFHGDLFAPLAPGAQFDVIASNPPYIPTAELATIDPGCAHEPVAALDGGPDGLRIVARLIAAAPAHLAAGGTLLLEIDPAQALLTAGMIADTQSFQPARIVKDLAGHARVVMAQRL